MQIDQLNNAGCERIFKEKITGTKKDRPELLKLLDHIRPGDTIIIVVELSRLSRSVKDLLNLIDNIQQKGANIKSLRSTFLLF